MPMRCALVGDPAGHSLSPAMHTAGYEANGLDWRYEACTVSAEDFDGWVRSRATNAQWAGLSVTAPHKERILAHGTPDEPAALVGAGNTIVFGREARVFNTDIRGFVVASNAADLPSPDTAVILGAGATARSALVALASMGLRSVTVEVRNPDRAGAIGKLAAALGVDLDVVSLGEGRQESDLMVNTVPLEATRAFASGMAARSGAIFDVVYDPWPSPLATAALELGRPALNGLDLLAGQAVDQFFLLTGHTITFELARSAAEQELGRRRSV